MDLRNINKIGLLLRIFGFAFLVVGVLTLFVPGLVFMILSFITLTPALAFILYQTALGVTHSTYELSFFYRILIGAPLVGFGILLLMKSPTSLHIARIANIVGASLLGMTIAIIGFSEKDYIENLVNENLINPGLFVFFYISLATIFHWILSLELDRIHQGKNITLSVFLRRTFLPGISIAASSLITLLLLT